MIKDECRNGNHVLIDSKFPLDEWKRFARQEEKQGVQPRVTIGDDIIVDGFGLTTTSTRVWLSTLWRLLEPELWHISEA